MNHNPQMARFLRQRLFFENINLHGTINYVAKSILNKEMLSWLDRLPCQIYFLEYDVVILLCWQVGFQKLLCTQSRICHLIMSTFS